MEGRLAGSCEEGTAVVLQENKRVTARDIIINVIKLSG
jgi:hypothetical protein